MSQTVYVAWRSEGSDGTQWGPIGRVEHGNGTYRFVYTRGAQLLQSFTPFPGMTDLTRAYESEQLFPFLSSRVLQRQGDEYAQYLRWSGFDPAVPPDPLAILAVTEGRRQTDSIEIFACPTPDADGCYTNKFFLHGVRHATEEARERIGRLNAGEPLSIRLEHLNDHDPNAVSVRATDQQGLHLGYVPRYLAGEVRQLLSGCDSDSVALNVERVNLDAPLQQRLLCRLRACWPLGFEPCDDVAFQPLNTSSAVVPC